MIILYKGFFALGDLIIRQAGKGLVKMSARFSFEGICAIQILPMATASITQL